MEKAKAIAHVKDMYAHMIFREDKEALETLIPELKESEDEMIRKLLIWQVHRNIDDLAQSVYDGIKGHDPDLEESIEDWKKCLAWLEKQKEQKPAEWSEEDEDMLNSCISSIEEAKENRYAYKETDGDTSYDHEIDWLKSLHPQPKQEWSEEDSINLNSILNHLKEYLTNGAYTYYESWLNSLRPSWKPSEEQMKALREVAYSLVGTGTQTDVYLVQLYEQLKAL